MKKERIDLLLVSRGFSETRAKAQALIMSGRVFLDPFYSKKVIKAGEKVSGEVEIYVREKLAYVSRGGQKLKAGVDEFDIKFNDLTVLDVGASTGGFTDCALQEGAKKVYALDVGKSLIDAGLRNDERVEVIENCNFRCLEPGYFGEKIDFVTVDVSFISLRYILPNVFEILCSRGAAIALIKPQFEAGRGETVKGILKDEKKRIKVKEDIKSFAQDLGFTVKGIIESPIKGGKGNIEYLMYMKKGR